MQVVDFINAFESKFGVTPVLQCLYSEVGDKTSHMWCISLAMVDYAQAAFQSTTIMLASC